MNRRHLLSAFAAAASGLILPYEPRRVYSFVGGWAETEYERAIRLAAGALREHFEQKLGLAPSPLGSGIAEALRSITLLPRGRWRVVPGTDILATKMLEMEFVPNEPREYEAVFA